MRFDCNGARTIIVLHLFFRSRVTAHLPPLYKQDPHDVQHPSFPPPSCSPALDRGFDISTTIHAIAAFCTHETGVVSAIDQQLISRTYAFASPPGDGSTIRIMLSWDNTGACRRSQLSLSPTQNSGRDCRTIYRNILLGCESEFFCLAT